MAVIKLDELKRLLKESDFAQDEVAMDNMVKKYDWESFKNTNTAISNDIVKFINSIINDEEIIKKSFENTDFVVCSIKDNLSVVGDEKIPIVFTKRKGKFSEIGNLNVAEKKYVEQIKEIIKKTFYSFQNEKLKVTSSDYGKFVEDSNKYYSFKFEFQCNIDDKIVIENIPLYISIGSVENDSSTFLTKSTTPQKVLNLNNKELILKDKYGESDLNADCPIFTKTVLPYYIKSDEFKKYVVSLMNCELSESNDIKDLRRVLLKEDTTDIEKNDFFKFNVTIDEYKLDDSIKSMADSTINHELIKNFSEAIGSIAVAKIIDSIHNKTVIEFPVETNNPLYDSIIKTNDGKNIIKIASKYGSCGGKESATTLINKIINDKDKVKNDKQLTAFIKWLDEYVKKNTNVDESFIKIAEFASDVILKHKSDDWIDSSRIIKSNNRNYTESEIIEIAKEYNGKSETHDIDSKKLKKIIKQLGNVKKTTYEIASDEIKYGSDKQHKVQKPNSEKISEKEYTYRYVAKILVTLLLNAVNLNGALLKSINKLFFSDYDFFIEIHVDKRGSNDFKTFNNTINFYIKLMYEGDSANYNKLLKSHFKFIMNTGIDAENKFSNQSIAMVSDE